MNTKDKIKRIIARNPELKETFIQVQEDEQTKKLLLKILNSNKSKVVIIGKDSERIARLYELATILTGGYPHITEVTTLDLLDSYVGDEDEQRFTSLSQVTDDIVIIHDSRAYLPNKQKTNMIIQVLEQNSHCIYYYKGTHKSFLVEHQSLLEYCKENNIPKINTDTNKQVYTKEEEV